MAPEISTSVDEKRRKAKVRNRVANTTIPRNSSGPQSWHRVISPPRPASWSLSSQRVIAASSRENSRPRAASRRTSANCTNHFQPGQPGEVDPADSGRNGSPITEDAMASRSGLDKRITDAVPELRPRLRQATQSRCRPMPDQSQVHRQKQPIANQLQTGLRQ